jgi:hypothetical protein
LLIRVRVAAWDVASSLGDSSGPALLRGSKRFPRIHQDPFGSADIGGPPFSDLVSR